MEVIGDALRQAFMPKHEYETLRDEDKAWGKLQRPLVTASMAVIWLLVIICTTISLNIVFPSDSGKRPFCSDERLQPLSMNAKGGVGGDSDLFPSAYYLTDQDNVDYYLTVVFFPSMLIFLLSALYLVTGKGKFPAFVSRLLPFFEFFFFSYDHIISILGASFCLYWNIPLLFY